MKNNHMKNIYPFIVSQLVNCFLRTDDVVVQSDSYQPAPAHRWKTYRTSHFMISYLLMETG